MKTLAADVRPAKIMRADQWTSDPRALRLLASCAQRPPVGGYQHGGAFALHREMDCQFVYSGYRAEALAAIRSEHGDRILNACHGTGDYTPFEAFCAEPSVTAAIDAAPLALTYARAGTDLRTTLMAVAAAPFEMAVAA